MADQIIRNGMERSELRLDNLSEERIIQSQLGSFKHRQDAMKYRLRKLEKDTGIQMMKRNRFMKEIPVEYKLVQNKRMNIRESSLESWKISPSIDTFESEIKPKKEELRKITKIYHLIQKFRARLKLKTL